MLSKYFIFPFIFLLISISGTLNFSSNNPTDWIILDINNAAARKEYNNSSHLLFEVWNGISNDTNIIIPENSVYTSDTSTPKGRYHCNKHVMPLLISIDFPPEYTSTRSHCHWRWCNCRKSDPNKGMIPRDTSSSDDYDRECGRNWRICFPQIYMLPRNIVAVAEEHKQFRNKLGNHTLSKGGRT